MNPILYALNHLRHSIPQDILHLAFSPRSAVNPTVRWGNNNDFSSLDHQIRDKVIEGRVNLDCDLVGGTQVAIDLRGVSYEQYDMRSRVFRIPYERSGGRRIVSVQTLNYLNYNGMPSYHHGTGDQLLQASMDMYYAVASMPIVSTANCQLIGDNVVLVQDNVQQFSDQLAMTCLVENDSEMSNLNPGAYMHYAKLVELATKAYIYIQLSIRIDEGVLHAGMNLGRIREFVDGYSDANEMYQEYFMSTWRRVSYTNDRVRMHSFVRSMMGRGR